MPLIRIKSLPFAGDVEVNVALGRLSQAISDATQIPQQHIMIVWEYLPAGHYVHGGLQANQQPSNSHPILVDMVAPNFNTEAQIAAMLELIAGNLSKSLPVAQNNIFINYIPAYSDGVYDDGHVVEWEN
ncbi:4-oxalocrotonate tautomerase family protein [Photobacterium sp. CCB-ST2H9]